ncbi:MAG TPA: FmdB family zinc ribbon protein [Candidatus Sulfomarinibacteraceae bacterium]|nr:FmdB family zinc ribbon protein [Candidatus Sulfomarinibacteraceae bacterium]
MPTYVYKCDNCEYSFEARQRMTDDPLTDCPQCEEASVRRVINNVGVVFKGKGFYVTDNRNGRSASTPNGSESSNGADASSTASDSKSSDGAASGTEKKAEGSSTEKASTS